MNRIISVFASIVLSLLSCSVFALSDDDLKSSPVGYWKTIDDVTDKPKAIVQIWETSDKTLSGRILKIYPRSGADQNPVCTACEGQNHNQRIVGMTILNNLKQINANTSRWANGQILDPKNGKTYHSTLQLAEDGQKLNVRGYVGIPLFGRSQTWIRVTDLNKV